MGTSSTVNITLGSEKREDPSKPDKCSDPVEPSNTYKSQEAQNEDKDCGRCKRSWCCGTKEICKTKESYKTEEIYKTKERYKE